MSAGLCLMWKEYRVLRGFWIALAIFGLACDGLIILFVANPQDRLPSLFGVVGLLPACFALGAGATLFALEREESTRELLQYLPLTSSRIFVSKVCVALSGTLLLTLVLLGVGLGGAWFALGNTTGARLGGESELKYASYETAVCTVMVLQAMGWSVFFLAEIGAPFVGRLLGSGRRSELHRSGASCSKRVTSQAGLDRPFRASSGDRRRLANRHPAGQHLAPWPPRHGLSGTDGKHPADAASAVILARVATLPPDAGGARCARTDPPPSSMDRLARWRPGRSAGGRFRSRAVGLLYLSGRSRAIAIPLLRGARRFRPQRMVQPPVVLDRLRRGAGGDPPGVARVSGSARRAPPDPIRRLRGVGTRAVRSFLVRRRYRHRGTRGSRLDNPVA